MKIGVLHEDLLVLAGYTSSPNVLFYSVDKIEYFTTLDQVSVSF